MVPLIIRRSNGPHYRSRTVLPVLFVCTQLSQRRDCTGRRRNSSFGFLLGFTHLDFDGSGFDADTRIALGFEGGIDYRITDSLGLRAGLRGVFTIVDTADGAFCTSSTSCPIVASDNSLEQWELFTGLSFRF